MNKIFYTYELIDPRNNEIFYIGKGQNKRMFSHYNKVKNNKHFTNKHLFCKIKQLINEGLKPIYNKILESENEIDCLKKEEERIKEIGLENLCNLTYGGESGIPSLQIRKKLSENTKKQWKNESFRKVVIDSVSKPMTQIHKDNISNSNKNKEKSIQHKLNISIGTKTKRWNKNEEREKYSKRLLEYHHFKGKHHTNEAKDKIRKANSGTLEERFGEQRAKQIRINLSIASKKRELEKRQYKNCK